MVLKQSMLTRKSLMRFCQLVSRQVRYQSKETSFLSVVELCHRGLVEVDGDDSFK